MHKKSKNLPKMKNFIGKHKLSQWAKKSIRNPKTKDLSFKKSTWQESATEELYQIF
jgi:hypothetical protein